MLVKFKFTLYSSKYPEKSIYHCFHNDIKHHNCWIIIGDVEMRCYFAVPSFIVALHKKLLKNITRGENQNHWGVSDIFGEMEIYIYIK